MFNPNVVVKNAVNHPGVNSIVSLVARFLLAYIFIASGYSKIAGYAMTQGYMEAMGVPGGILPLVILIELGGGLAVLFGFQTRFVALGLGIFSILAAFLFHVGGADAATQYNNAIHFMKNLAMAGGFFFLMAHGAGRISLDHAIEK